MRIFAPDYFVCADTEITGSESAELRRLVIAHAEADGLNSPRRMGG
ncbi:MAG: hypothetical protein IJ155_07585 [Prevotella sp.]|nr:hypothetical protein [Prevotella sp.]